MGLNFTSVLKQFQVGGARDIDLLSTTSTGDEWDPVSTDIIEDTLDDAVEGSVNKDDLEGTLVKKDDVVFLTTWAEREITTADKIRDNDKGNTYTIIHVKVTRPGLTILLQKIFCRK